MPHESIGEEYVRLALAIDQHLPGYVDAYIGPPAWQQQANAEGKHPLAELTRRAAAMAEAIDAAEGMDAQRKDYLERHTLAMRTSLRLLSGEKMPLADEVELLYDLRPTWVEEELFEKAHRQLDELLPAGGTLQERTRVRKEALEISVERAGMIVPLVQDRFRETTRRLFPLPADERVDFEFVEHKPWWANNQYLGGHRSRVDLNTDLPMRANTLLSLVAHEAYPGHHTEQCIKEQRLLEQQGRIEHSVTVINAPECVVMEGIATSARSVVISDEALTEWYREEVLPRAGLDPSLAEAEQRILGALETLYGADGNAAFMLHDRGAGVDETSAYLQRFGLRTELEARKRIEFMMSPIYRSYIFTYYWGRNLLASLLEQKQDVIHWYGRLLAEPVTPSQIRGWIAG